MLCVFTVVAFVFHVIIIHFNSKAPGGMFCINTERTENPLIGRVKWNYYDYCYLRVYRFNAAEEND